MIELVYKIIDVDTQVFYLIVLVSMVSVILQREIVGSDLFTYISIPTFIGASLISLYLFRTYQLLMIGDRIVEVIAASVVGITVSFIGFMLFIGITAAITGWNVQRMLKARQLDRRAPEDRAKTR